MGASHGMRNPSILYVYEMSDRITIGIGRNVEITEPTWIHNTSKSKHIKYKYFDLFECVSMCVAFCFALNF